MTDFISQILFLLLGLLVGPQAAQAAQVQYRYHLISISHDDVPLNADADGRCRDPASASSPEQVERQEKRGTVYRELGAIVSADGCSTSKYWLANPTRDQKRFEQHLMRYASPRLVSSLTPFHTGPWLPATNNTPNRGANTIEQVDEAFLQTQCRLQKLRGKDAAGCDDVRGLDIRGDEDVVFIVFAGHGTDNGLVLKNGVYSSNKLEEKIASLDADRVVVIVDACNGAGMTSEVVVDKTSTYARVFVPTLFERGVREGPPRVAVFKAATHYLVPEDLELKSGILTHVVLSGLMGAADDDTDGDITFEELSSFFLMNTRGTGLFDADAVNGGQEIRDEGFERWTAAPGGDRQAVLLRLQSRDENQPKSLLRIPRALGGRLLITAEGGVVAEVNVTRHQINTYKTVELHLPLAEYRMYFLPITDGQAGPVVTWIWSPAQNSDDKLSVNGEPPPPDDKFAAYLRNSQEKDGLFSKQIVPLHSMSLGNQVVLTGLFGYQYVPIYGRIEEDYDVSQAYGVNTAQGDLMQDLQSSQPQVWNMLHAGGILRFHGLKLFHAELRPELQWTPRSRTAGLESGVFIGRVLGGVGFSGHPYTRLLIGTISAGWGPMMVYAYDRGETSGGVLPALDLQPNTSRFLAGSLSARLPRRGPVTLEIALFEDQVTLCDEPLAVCTAQTTEQREYFSWRVSVGRPIGRWPR